MDSIHLVSAQPKSRLRPSDFEDRILGDDPETPGQRRLGARGAAAVSAIRRLDRRRLQLKDSEHHP